MRPAFQAYVDARGDIHIAEGVVIDRENNTTFPIGDTGLADPGLAGGLAPYLAAVEEIPTGQDSILIGGSGSNLIVTGIAPFAGVWRPGRPGEWFLDDFTLHLTGTRSANITDGTDTVANLNPATATLFPAADYTATAYGQTTYHAGAPFVLTATAETGWPGGRVNLEVTPSEGTATGGTYTATDSAHFTSATDPDWTLTLHADGAADIYYLSTPIATRAEGLPTDPCGLYTATAAGRIFNPATPETDTGESPETNPFGILTLTFNWAGAPDLDIAVTFLDETAGYGYGYAGPAGPYMEWSGDNQTTGGPETVTIDLAAAWEEGDLSTFADILAEADWFTGAGGSGPATLTVDYSLASTPVDYTLHPGQASPATTPALCLRILADGTFTPRGEEWFAYVNALRRVPVAGAGHLV